MIKQTPAQFQTHGARSACQLSSHTHLISIGVALTSEQIHVRMYCADICFPNRPVWHTMWPFTLFCAYCNRVQLFPYIGGLCGIVKSRKLDPQTFVINRFHSLPGLDIYRQAKDKCHIRLKYPLLLMNMTKRRNSPSHLNRIPRCQFVIDFFRGINDNTMYSLYLR